MSKSKLQVIMNRDAERSKEEDRPLLFPEDDCQRMDGFPVAYETAVTHGAVHYLGKWPSHLFAVFVAGCLVFAMFFIFALITVIFSVSVDNRRIRNVEIDNDSSGNVYFVKHENRTWSDEELCFIEIAAREHPDLNIYLMNLLNEEPNGKKMKEFMIELIDVKREIRSMLDTVDFLQVNNSTFTVGSKSDENMRKRLADVLLNVRNIDVTVEHFFNGSRLDKIYRQLDDRGIEFAARTHILWNFPGIALEPVLYSSLTHVRQFLYENCKDKCKSGQIATIEPNGDLLATGITCQAFIGVLMEEILKSRTSVRQNTLREAISKFCPRTGYCPGVRIYKFEKLSSLNILHCPTIYPEGIPSDSKQPSKKYSTSY
ncbi:uncharacterized protein LOC107265575 isoform X2 [Cephus cinctus]|uniref:Uncharacterized protein LOC107265575 isoform X2 n=1 Tax=Cephus cinctus TaxID=211228 RepID=A0AAJ7BNT1_CEPCN|nr:uncharacterized protein LOC107265575 isoform X2 [Cephus cinctus]